MIELPCVRNSCCLPGTSVGEVELCLLGSRLCSLHLISVPQSATGLCRISIAQKLAYSAISVGA